MRVPKDISGADLVKTLSQFGYVVTRQTGSHIRLTTPREGEHHITIPNHDHLRVGTLNAIIADVADHLKMSKTDLLDRIF